MIALADGACLDTGLKFAMLHDRKAAKSHSLSLCQLESVCPACFPAGLSSGSLAGAGASSGGSSYCLSPPNTSPPMSRESSSQGPLSSLATPEALQLRGKSKGRFQVRVFIFYCAFRYGGLVDAVVLCCVEWLLVSCCFVCEVLLRGKAAAWSEAG
jgi:hypothetical protein